MLSTYFLAAILLQSQNAQESASQGWYVVSPDEVAYRQLSQLRTWKERDAKAAELGLIKWDGLCRYYISPALTGDLGLQLNARLLQYLQSNSAWEKPVSKATHDPSDFSAFRSIFERSFSSAYTSEPNWESDLSISPQLSFRGTRAKSIRGNTVGVLLKGPAVNSGGIRVTPGLTSDGNSAPEIDAMREAQVLQPGFSLLGNSARQNASFATSVLTEVLAELRKRQDQNREKYKKLQAEFLGSFAGEFGQVSPDSQVANLPKKIQDMLFERGLAPDEKLTDCRIYFSLNFRLKNPDGTYSSVSFTPFMAL